ncbi:unnamed protein product [Protopolystoma xenopodis]|uniref:Uncharacterized protein n=1 Tax=Protopolystoma xenopodis TaxID=117903 RepID=A0A448WNP5_9PLAT|nr:unnamed protein product [Protopolystoma xenopodis]
MHPVHGYSGCLRFVSADVSDQVVHFTSSPTPRARGAAVNGHISCRVQNGPHIGAASVSETPSITSFLPSLKFAGRRSKPSGGHLFFNVSTFWLDRRFHGDFVLISAQQARTGPVRLLASEIGIVFDLQRGGFATTLQYGAFFPRHLSFEDASRTVRPNVRHSSESERDSDASLSDSLFWRRTAGRHFVSFYMFYISLSHPFRHQNPAAELNRDSAQTPILLRIIRIVGLSKVSLIAMATG